MGRITERIARSATGGSNPAAAQLADTALRGAGRVVTTHTREVASRSARRGAHAALGGRRGPAGGKGGGILSSLSAGGHTAVREFATSFTRGLAGRFGRAASAEAATHIGNALANSALAKKHPIVGRIAGRVRGDRPRRRAAPADHETSPHSTHGPGPGGAHEAPAAPKPRRRRAKKAAPSSGGGGPQDRDTSGRFA